MQRMPYPPEEGTDNYVKAPFRNEEHDRTVTTAVQETTHGDLPTETNPSPSEEIQEEFSAAIEAAASQAVDDSDDAETRFMKKKAKSEESDREVDEEGEGMSDTAKDDDDFLLREHNSAFYSNVQSYYNISPCGKHLFEGVLLEFLKWTQQTTLYAQVFDLLMDGSNEELKRVVTVDIWERTQRYTDQIKQQQESRFVAMFTHKELPLILNNNNISTVAMAAFSSTKRARSALSKQQEALTNNSTKRKRSATAAPGAPRLPPKEQRKYLDGPPREKDVLFGRGGGTNNHKGNVLYLLQKLKLQVPYTLVATQKGKTALSQRLVDMVHTQGGRFVARDSHNDDRWFEVDDATARRKASQTLREDKTPRDQESKRKTLLRKLADMKQQEQPQLQHANASEDRVENNYGLASIVGAEVAPLDLAADTSDDGPAARPLSLQEQKAGETLLELNAATSNTADV